jgi:hypothetical protein
MRIAASRIALILSPYFLISGFAEKHVRLETKTAGRTGRSAA